MCAAGSRERLQAQHLATCLSVVLPYVSVAVFRGQSRRAFQSAAGTVVAGLSQVRNVLSDPCPKCGRFRNAASPKALCSKCKLKAQRLSRHRFYRKHIRGLTAWRRCRTCREIIVRPKLTQKYCSQVCIDEAEAIRGKLKARGIIVSQSEAPGMRHLATGWGSRKCVTCLVEYRPLTAGQKFCGKRCYGRWHEAKRWFPYLKDNEHLRRAAASVIGSFAVARYPNGSGQ